MKKIFLLLLLLPALSFASKKQVPNPCDSINQVIPYSKNLSKVEVLERCEKAIGVIISGKTDILKPMRLNDSTILVTGNFVLRKTSGYMQSIYYGRYTVPHHSDGEIAFNMIITCHSSHVNLKFTDITHHNCKNALGRICEEILQSNDTILKGVIIQFLHKVEDMYDVFKLSLNN